MQSNYYSIKLPENRKARVELWKYLKQTDLQKLLDLFEEKTEEDDDDDDEDFFLTTSIDSGRGKNVFLAFSSLVSKLLKLNASDARQAILIEKYYYLIRFARSKQFNVEQTSALVSIFTRTHDLACDTAFGNLDETFDYFKELVLVYAVHRPPFSISLFTPQQIQLVVQYFFDSYFKQFKLFKYVFTPEVVFDVQLKYNGLKPTADDELNLALDVDALKESEFMKQTSERNEDVALQSQLANNDEKENLVELRQFIKGYLDKKLDVVKDELMFDELMQQKHNTAHAKHASHKADAQKTSKSRSELTKSPKKK